MATAGDATVGSMVAILKTRFDQKKFYQLFYESAPFAGQVAKNTEFGGNNVRVSLRYGSPQGGSFKSTVAAANATTSSDVAFTIPRVTDYQFAGISGEALAAGNGKDNSVYDVLKGEQEGSMRNLNRSVQLALWRNGGGQRAQGNSSYTITGTTATLSQAADIVGFEVGMRVEFSADDGYNNGGALAGVRTGGALQIQSLDRTAGTITFTQAISPTLTGVTNADFLFRAGDYGGGCAGVQRWLPATAPTAGDSHFNVDRSADPVRLAGVRYTGNGGNKEETLIDGLELLGREGATDVDVFINNLDRADIVKSLGSKAIFEPAKDVDGVVGYRAIRVETANGSAKLMSDINVPRGKFFALTMSTWTLRSAGKFPAFLDGDGMQMLREPNGVDAYQWRMGGYFNLICEAPGLNLVGTW